ncbi:hypothetical protein D3C87_1551140 [compost metagenome]
MLELLGQGRFTTTDRAEQVKDLFLLFQALSGMAEIRHDLVDAFFHPVEVFKGRIAADDLVGEDARQSRVGRGVEQFRFTDGQQ